jgi:hypothetical protein
MVTIRITADVPDDRQLTLTPPAEVPTGPAEVVITMDSHAQEREHLRAEALKRLLAIADASNFCSEGPILHATNSMNAIDTNRPLSTFWV